jgi:hypothetical protein
LSKDLSDFRSYKYATYAAMLKRDGLVVDDSGQLPTRLFRDERTFAANREATSATESISPITRIGRHFSIHSNTALT